MFGYRVLGFGSSAGGGAEAIVFPGWSATLTMGTNATKGGHASYGFDLQSVHDNNAHGSISDGTLDGYQFLAASGESYEDATLSRLVWHDVGGSSALTGVRFKITREDLSNNFVTPDESNIKDLTLTIGSTDFVFSESQFNKADGLSGYMSDFFWETGSNPFGTTTDSTTHTVSINAGS